VMKVPTVVDSRVVRDAMSRSVVTIDADDMVSKASALMKACGIGALPVRRGEGLVGIVTDRDITVRASAQGADVRALPVSEVMTPQLWFIPPDSRLDVAARLMGKLGVHRLAVVDGDLRLVGLLSVDDLPPDLRPLVASASSAG
jgi:CBS domain-containing protein